MSQATPSLGELYLRKCYPQNHVLSTWDFERHCRDRGLDIDRKFLEDLERERLLTPVLRIERARIPYKLVVKQEDGKRREYYVPLDEGRDPSAATDHRYSGVSTNLVSLRRARDLGLVEFPEAVPFRPWSEYEDGWEETALAYYHPLQILMAREARWLGTISFQDSIVDAPPEEVAQSIARARERTEINLRMARDRIARDERLIRLLMAIEDAILPDLRGVFIGSEPTRDVDEQLAVWSAWRRELNWKALLAASGWSTEELKELYVHWSVQAQAMDPMEKWYLLVRNIPYRRRKELKGSALLAQDYYEIALMLKAAYEEATGERLPPPDDVMDASGGSWKVNWYGTMDIFGERRARLRLLTEYGLNPVHRVHLVIEGLTERIFVEKVASAWNISLEALGVELHELEGVGRLKPEHLRRLLWHAVDEGAVAYVIVDNDEGVWGRIKDLIRTSGPKGEPLLRRDFCTKWEGEFEDDNFTTEEIADAFNNLAESLGSEVRIGSEELHQRLTSAAGKPKKVTKALRQLATEKGDVDLDGHRAEFARFLAQIAIKKTEEKSARLGHFEPSTPMEEELRKIACLVYALREGARLETSNGGRPG